MSIRIKSDVSKTDWDEFLARRNPHTFLQDWEWGEAQMLNDHQIFRLGIVNDDKLAAAAFVYLIKAKRGSFLFCPHGPLLDFKKKELLEALISYLKKLGKKEKADFIRISPLAADTDDNRQLFRDLGFRAAPVHMMHPELAWLLDLKPSEEELLKNMKKRTRYSINKAQKESVEVVSSSNPEDVEKFYDLYLETAGRQKFVPFSKGYIKKEFAIFSKENKIALYFGYHDKKLIAGAMVVFANGSGFYHHGASTREKGAVPAAELLQWEAIKEAKRRGCDYYDFWGIAPEDRPHHPWAGLSMFKKGFGGFSESYLHCQDLALTPKYWLNFAIESVRRMAKGY